MSNKKFDKLNSEANELANSGKLEEAISKFAELPDLASDDEGKAKAYYNWGTTLSDLAKLKEDEGLYAEACEKYVLAVKFKEDEHETYNNWGNALSDLAKLKEDEGLYAESFKKYALAIKYKKDFPKAYNNWGTALLNLARQKEDEGLFAESFKKYALAIKYKEDKHEAYYNWGISIYDLAVVKSDVSLFEEALSKFDKVKALLEGKEHTLDRVLDYWEDRIKSEIAKLNQESSDESSTAKLFSFLDEIKPIRSDEQANFWGSLLSPRTIKEDDKLFCILRRFNSYTPSMYTNQTESKGGGYFIAWNGKGIVIDPGISFIDNFTSQGFTLKDIDAIVLTHDHFDHTHDFEALLTLIYELNDLIKESKDNPRRKKEIEDATGHNMDLEEEREIALFFNRGAASKFMAWTNFHTSIINVITMNHGDSIKRNEFDFILKVCKAKHRELFSKGYATGLVFEFLNEGKLPFIYKGKQLKIGLPNDTGYSDEIAAQYRECQMIVPHLGTVDVDYEQEVLRDPSGSARKKHSHLGVDGLSKLLDNTKEDGVVKLALISEFEEELKSKRHFFAGYFNDRFKEHWKCLTADIGLKIRLSDLKVFCLDCTDCHIDFKEISSEVVNGEEISWIHKSSGFATHSFSGSKIAAAIEKRKTKKA